MIHRRILFVLMACGMTGGSLVFGQEGAPARIPEISSLELAAWIDKRFDHEFKQLGLKKPPVVNDETFMRRVYLDLIGSVPSVSSVRDFHELTGSFKREDLVDQLVTDMARPDMFAERSSQHLARIWRRAMIPKSSPGIRVAERFEPWLERHFRDNTPYDEFAMELVSTQPAAQMRGLRGDPAAPDAIQFYYQAVGAGPTESAEAISRYFLGVRIGCAKCHDHPFTEREQADFWGMAAFFSGGQAGALPTIRDETGRSYPAKYLWGPPPKPAEAKAPRTLFADWLVAPQNPNFSATAVNRVWQQLCGRGIVETADDLDQVTTEERAVLDDLAELFEENGYNVRWLITGICKSDFYRRVSLRGNDTENYNPYHRPLKTLTPEQVFDSLEQVLSLPIGRIDNPPRYNGLRNAFVARMDETASDSPEEFRAGIPQALMVMNGKVTADATDLKKSFTLRAVVDAPFLRPSEKIETLYLAAFTRRPSDDELKFMLQHIDRQPTERRKQAYADIFWGLINSPEFVLSR